MKTNEVHMSNILILNAHHYYPFSEGKLNKSLVELARHKLEEKGYLVRVVETRNEFDVAEQLENHQWADTIILQSPVNWMGVPWSFKKYMDEIYTAGMGGELCNGDGRTSEEPLKNYGGGGTQTGKSYMLSLTFNAPAEAFNDEQEYLFQGKNVDDLFFPMHMNFRFFGMQPIETFSCHDVMKNPDVERDFERYGVHLDKHFPEVS